MDESLSRRREERAAEQLGQETVNHISELTENSLEIWQKQIACMATAAHYLGDSFNAISRAMAQMIQQTERLRDQQSRRVS